jgi:hypothetical protein
MPFIKEYVEPTTHAVANYWAVTSMMYDGLKDETDFVMGVFVSDLAHSAGALPVDSVVFNSNAGQLTVQQCEDIVKARPEFSDAEEV